MNLSYTKIDRFLSCVLPIILIYLMQRNSKGGIAVKVVNRSNVLLYVIPQTHKGNALIAPFPLAERLLLIRDVYHMTKEEIIEEIIQKWIDQEIIVLKSDRQCTSQPEQPHPLKGT